MDLLRGKYFYSSGDLSSGIHRIPCWRFLVSKASTHRTSPVKPAFCFVYVSIPQDCSTADLRAIYLPNKRIEAIRIRSTSLTHPTSLFSIRLSRHISLFLVQGTITLSGGVPQGETACRNSDATKANISWNVCLEDRHNHRHNISIRNGEARDTSSMPGIHLRSRFRLRFHQSTRKRQKSSTSPCQSRIGSALLLPISIQKGGTEQWRGESHHFPSRIIRP